MGLKSILGFMSCFQLRHCHFMRFVLTIVFVVGLANCQDVAVSLRGAAPRRANQNNSNFINITNSVNQPVRVGTSCSDSYTIGTDVTVQINLTQVATRFWIVPKSLEWDCNQPCSECFYFEVALLNNASGVTVNVGYGDHMNSTARSLDTDNVTSTEVHDFVPADHNETSIAGVDVWDNEQNLRSSCTVESCDLDPVELGRDGMTKLETWGGDKYDNLEASWVGPT